MDIELSDAHWKAPADDDLEGTCFTKVIYPLFELTSPVQGRLAASRNANNESEVDESMLNTGLFTYPVLQAADILAYRF